MKPEHHPDIVVVGASAGGVEALKQLVSGLPPGMHAAVFVVLHILAAESLHPADGVLIETGKIYVAPPDRHLILQGESIRVAGRRRTGTGHPSMCFFARRRRHSVRAAGGNWKGIGKCS